MEFYGTWFAGSADRASRAVLVVSEAAESADQGKSAITAWDRLLLLVPMLATVLLADRLATQEALRDAWVRGFSIGNLIAAPLVNAKVRAHVPGASNELTTVLRNRMGDGSVIHIKLCDKNAVVIWSDKKGLVGRRFPLTSAVRAQFGPQAVAAEVCDFSQAQYQFNAEYSGERRLGELLQVCAATRDADKKPMVFEAHYPSNGMGRDERAIIDGFLPIVIAALLLSQLAVLPMAMSLARQVVISPSLMPGTRPRRRIVPQDGSVADHRSSPGQERHRTRL